MTVQMMNMTTKRDKDKSSNKVELSYNSLFFFLNCKLRWFFYKICEAGSEPPCQHIHLLSKISHTVWHKSNLVTENKVGDARISSNISSSSSLSPPATLHNCLYYLPAATHTYLSHFSLYFPFCHPRPSQSPLELVDSAD